MTENDKPKLVYATFPSGAEAERDRCGGEVGTLEELAGLRRAWREARRAQYAEPVGGGGK